MSNILAPRNDKIMKIQTEAFPNLFDELQATNLSATDIVATNDITAVNNISATDITATSSLTCNTLNYTTLNPPISASPRVCNASWYTQNAVGAGNYVGKASDLGVMIDNSANGGFLPPVDTATALFTCRYDGVYICSYQGQSASGSPNEIRLLKNNTIVLPGAFLTSQNTTDMTSASLSLYCNAGEFLGFWVHLGSAVSLSCSIALLS